MRPEERDAAYLWDMLDAAQTTEHLTAGLSFAEYNNDRRTQLALERSLEIVGEAAGKVSSEFKQAHPQIPWRRIIGQRNVLVHEYGEIKQDRLWRVVKENIPELINILKLLV